MRRIADAERRLIYKCLYKKFTTPIKNFNELLQHLASLHNGQLPQTDDQSLRLGKGAVFRMFRRELDRIANNLTDSQATAFQFDLITDVYEKDIVEMGKFVFNAKSKVVFDPSSSGSVIFEVILPFEDKDLKDVRWPNCVFYFDLPHFFHPNLHAAKSSQSTTTPVSDEPTEPTESTNSAEPT